MQHFNLFFLFRLFFGEKVYKAFFPCTEGVLADNIAVPMAGDI